MNSFVRFSMTMNVQITYIFVCKNEWSLFEKSFTKQAYLLILSNMYILQYLFDAKARGLKGPAAENRKKTCLKYN